MTTYDVVWPRSERRAEDLDPAPRPSSLDGATIAFLWDDMFRGDEIFPMLERELSTRFTDVTFVQWSEFGSTHGEGEAELVASLGHRLQELGVDAAISGMGC